MSEILNLIMARRSIRKYTPDAVTDSEIKVLLQAAMAAPSASNRRPWEFVVVTDPQVLQRLRSHLVLGSYDAPVAVVVCGNQLRAWPGSARDFWVQDCSAAAQNVLLASIGIGLGAVWVGIHPVRLFVRAVSKTLGLPKHVIPLGLIWVGRPAEAKPARTQYDARRVHWQRFGGGDLGTTTAPSEDGASGGES